jgi:hypothetical protein
MLDGKWTKVPYNAKTGRHASSTDSQTWSRFDEAVRAMQTHEYSGVGLVLSDSDDLVGIDLDGAVNPATGLLEPWAHAIVTRFNSYCEYSPSRSGVHIFCRGTLPETGRRMGSVEMYRAAHYFTITGVSVPDTPRTIERRSDELLVLYQQYFAAKPASVNGHAIEPTVELDDRLLVEKMLSAANGAKVRPLWDGNISDYPSQSEADAALCSHLAFWTGRNPLRMDALFRLSGLMRAKWDERHFSDGRTYGQTTIARACETCRETYKQRPERQIVTDHKPQLSEKPSEQIANAGIRHSEEKGSSPDDSCTSDLIGIGLGEFLAQEFPASEPYIEGILNNDGGGWIGGEEKLGKSYYALEEALCLACGWPVCGRFAVPVRRRVVFMEEEDPPSRTQRRLNALLRGHGLDPDDAGVRADLNQWFRISVWRGFTLDAQPDLDTLARTLANFQPVITYMDVLRKLTTKDLNKSDQAGTLLKSLDDLRREYGCLFRIVAHYRKIQGSHRAGRGSQELGGSFQLGAWGECSLWFEPMGRKQGATRVEIQRKDGEPMPPFALRFESEGPAHAPTLVRLHVDEINIASKAEESKEKVFGALSSLTPVDVAVVKSGGAGVTVKQIAEFLKVDEKTVRRALDLLKDEKRCLDIGKMSKGKKLYTVLS